MERRCRLSQIERLPRRQTSARSDESFADLADPLPWARHLDGPPSARRVYAPPARTKPVAVTSLAIRVYVVLPSDNRNFLTIHNPLELRIVDCVPAVGF